MTTPVQARIRFIDDPTFKRSLHYATRRAGAPARHLWHGFRALAPDSRRSSASHSALAAGDSRMGLQRTATCGSGRHWAELRMPRGVIQSTRAVVTGEAGCRDVTGGQPDGLPDR